MNYGAMNFGAMNYDVIVVGFGAAGAAAAIEAADRGARVLVLDRGYGGGATALSGGIVYAGGGTAEQHAGGYHDSVEDMRAYLESEVGDSVSGETLDRFCRQSPAMIEWLKAQGVEFRGGEVPTYKTSYPTDDFYLYYSGNEKAYPYAGRARPVPRGHRVLARGMSSGKVLFDRLARSARHKGVEFIPLAQVHSLIQDDDGRIAGVRYRALDPAHPNARKHKVLTKLTGKAGTWMPGLVEGLVARAEEMRTGASVDAEARAPAVILAAGGFVHNREWMQAHAPQFMKVSPLGTVGDDGTGIALGLAAGGVTGKMDNVTAWRFLSPPSAFLEGLTVGADGRRIANEDLYGATHGNVLMRDFGGTGWAIYDAQTWRKVKSQIRTQTQIFQRLQLIYLFTIGHKKAASIEDLAAENGIDAEGLRRTVDEYHRGLANGAGDPAHKDPELCPPLLTPPFYSIDISADSSMFFPIPGLTLGGLLVDESTGEILGVDGESVPGLYAAGRNAVGVCSNSYVSGLSLADCIFSGRRAGAHAADGLGQPR
ncbi:pyridine nucleotide-disulfide oxidoreductase [Mycolicibacterium monacense]|uniref:Pyridine nucleotide-disulfide oxidoreductase n=2 Tax=Mycolicibacterium monacense TaxID=85693 RepID=A0AAD1IY66_MYCMB|nr:pyridine nucleotide-disulfide oxidoreductase [Mycolicibacterium monacense DSM 44395]BBZ63109.1 pyridine nucleotide-disulfide oxidoreductase [Mycolicibacterium monacense]